MAKTIILNEKNVEGNYILYSGEERKRKYDFFGYSDKIHFVRKKQSISEVELCLRENDEIMVLFKYEVENKPHYLFSRSFQNKGNKDKILIEGKNLITTYKIFEIMNNARKIPCEPSYLGGGLLGDLIPKGINIESEIYWKTYNELSNGEFLKEALEWKFNFLGDKYAINYLTFLHKKTRIPREKIKQIENSSLLDDKKEKITESDLVEIILQN
jgi:hypothetical protein